MADHYSLCLLGVMDRLWFHQIILFPETSSTVLLSKTLKQQTPLITSSLINLPSTLSFSTSTEEEEEEEAASPASPLSEEDISSTSESTPITLEFKKVNLNDRKGEQEDMVVNEKERPTRLNLATSRARSHSSSPSTAKRLTKNIGLRKVLQKSMSCRSLGELELEEVKGFMDLGFIFKKEQISPRMISVVPGLSRLGLYKHKHNTTKLINSEVVPEDEDCYDSDDHDIVRDDQQEQEKGIIRPYLSEAWLIRRPDSPLLNLRLPKVSAAADMKKHLKFWARTVASEIQQES
ncbi:uncharacterized protein LOC8284549 [Ricinus communis]|nr:uncharacterized protein LOC8284549 [Ricinus communis]